MPLADRPKRDNSIEAAMVAEGFCSFGEALDPGAAEALLANVRATRELGPNLFLSEAEWDANPVHIGANPKPGRNLAECFPEGFDFIERDPTIVSALAAILGPDYEVFDKQFVCGVPESWTPEWLLKRLRGKPVNNLGGYMKPEYRDITYFHGIDCHQDLIYHSRRKADFLTLHIDLHDVTTHEAPLFVMPRSHCFGATSFPHDLSAQGAGIWRYGDGRGKSTLLGQRVLTGGAGYAAMWHACVLNGAQPNTADRERISVRYKIARGKSADCGIDRINAAMDGPVILPSTRLETLSRALA